MVASTDIKFYVHTNNNAPQLQNAYGSMINVLDACLVNGINIGAISSLIASGTTVTATFSAAHNLMRHQVIKITGANQTEYNVEARVLTVPNSTTITFELATTPSASQATGLINASLAPMGWEKSFSSSHATAGGKAAYRSANLLLPSRPFLRVVDELDPAHNPGFAKYAKVGIVEEMTGINTLTGHQCPYDAENPGKNWIGIGADNSAFNGWAKWFYASNGDAAGTINKNYSVENGIRKWVIVGNGDSFYILNNYLPGNTDSLIPYGFGILNDHLPLDSTPYFLSATDDYTTAGTTAYASLSNALTTTSPSSGLFLLRKVDGSSYHTKATTTSISKNVLYSGYGDTFLPPNSRIPVIHTSQVVMDGAVPRGTTPFIKFLYQNLPYTNLQGIVERNQILLAVKVMAYSFQGEVVFNIGYV